MCANRISTFLRRGGELASSHGAARQPWDDGPGIDRYARKRTGGAQARRRATAAAARAMCPPLVPGSPYRMAAPAALPWPPVSFQRQPARL
jgi:hypothetical protein